MSSTTTDSNQAQVPDASAKTHPPRTRADPTRYDPPLQHKVGLLVTLACVGGFGLGVYAQYFDEAFWKFSALLVVGMGALWWLSGWWVAMPIKKLADQSERLSRTGLASTLRHLPVGRRDEIGRIAKSLHTMGVIATRSHMEARSLRSTLDERVVKATKRATSDLKRLVMRDPLTDLGNRRFLNENLELLFDSAKESGTDLICVMMDLDHFKRVNDQLGHEAGDHLLVFLAGLIRATSRHDDIAVRLGGDEFVLVMPGVNHARATEVVAMIHKLFTRQAHTMFPNCKGLDLSYGIASLLADDCPDTKTLLRTADKRLYGNKGESSR